MRDFFAVLSEYPWTAVLLALFILCLFGRVRT
jgi:hypothetical protein